MKDRRTLFIPLFILFSSLVFISPISGLQTNQAVQVRLPSSSFLFKEVKKIEFEIPPAQTVLDVSWTNVSFLRHSLELHLAEMHSNQFSLLARNYEISNFVFPSLIVTSLDKNGTNRYYTPALPLTVGTNFTNVQKPAPLMGIFAIRSWLWLWILAGIIVLGVIAFFIVRIVQRARTNPHTRKIKDPYEYVRNTVSAMPINTLNPDQYRAYCEMISESTRRFLENTVDIPAMEYSTKEIRESLAHLKMEQEIQDITRHILSICDRVKYAKHEPEYSLLATLLSELLSLLFHISRHTGQHFSHNLKRFESRLHESGTQLYESDPREKVMMTLKSVLIEFIYDFFFLKIDVLDANALFEAVQDLIPAALRQELKNLWDGLNETGKISLNTKNVFIEQMGLFMKGLAAHFGYREYIHTENDPRPDGEEK